MDWISHHPVRRYEAPRTGISISSAWKDALWAEGMPWRLAAAISESELDNAPFRDVLAAWVERLLTTPEHFSSRIDSYAHAARALQHKDTQRVAGTCSWSWRCGRSGSNPRRPTIYRIAKPASTQRPKSLRCARGGAATFVASHDSEPCIWSPDPMAYMMIADDFGFLGSWHCGKRLFGERTPRPWGASSRQR